MAQADVTAAVVSGSEIPVAPTAPSQVPHRGRAFTILVEFSLIILLAYLVVNAFYSYLTPSSDFTAVVKAETSDQMIGSQQVSYDTIVSFDPFYRETRAITASTNAAPESSLNITIAGLRAGAGGKGTAIIDVQGNGQKLIVVGDEISPGVSLSQVYSDRIEISRRGIRETVYMVKPSANISGPANTVISRNDNGTPARAPQLGNVNFSDMLARIRLEPVRDETNRRIAGFRILDETPQSLLSAAGLEAGDIILAVNGSPLTSFERMQELGEELRSASAITIDIDRRGQQIALTL